VVAVLNYQFAVPVFTVTNGVVYVQNRVKLGFRVRDRRSVRVSRLGFGLGLWLVIRQYGPIAADGR